MALSPLDSMLWSGLFGDADMAALVSDEAEIAAMIEVERALARAEAAAGVIPPAAGKAIDRGLANLSLDPLSLARGTASAGVPVPALVASLRAHLPEAAAHWLHWGATSQDILDGGAVLRLLRATALLQDRLAALLDRLDQQARAHAATPMAARTRSQIATPIPFGLRIANWAAPLIMLESRLPEVCRTLGRVQLGGASGANAVLGAKAQTVAEALAWELGLAPAPPWGTARVGMAELGAWAAQLSAALGRIGGDLILMGRSEAGEAAAGQGGGSSTMPQKQNPVAAEAMVTLGRMAGAHAGALNGAVLHGEERDATAWALEWMALPPLIVGAGAGLRLAWPLIDTLRPDPAAMRRMLDLGGGAVHAEAAAFALARHMPRAEAARLVAEAAREVGAPLAKAIANRTDAPVDWAKVTDLEPTMDAGAATIEAIFAERSARPRLPEC
ncbi:MAG: lyase family protein [Pseudomonadota bacterium]